MLTFEYDDCYLLFGMRLWTNYLLEGHHNGVVFYGNKGTVEIGRHGCHVTLIGEERRQLGGGIDLGAHVRNFLDCVKADDPTSLHVGAEIDLDSAALCHLGNVATRVGRRLGSDSDATKCMGDAEATKLLGRTYRTAYELPRIG